MTKKKKLSKKKKKGLSEKEFAKLKAELNKEYEDELQKTRDSLWKDLHFID